MTASDDARQAIARAAIADADKWQGRKFGVDDVLAAVMPDGRTIAQWLDALAALEAACRTVERHGPDEWDLDCHICGHPWPCPIERIQRLMDDAS